jgi:hypothetical protein
MKTCRIGRVDVGFWQSEIPQCSDGCRTVRGGGMRLAISCDAFVAVVVIQGCGDTPSASAPSSDETRR